MNGQELLDKMELIDPAYTEKAEFASGKKKTRWIPWGAAACLCVMIGSALLLRFGDTGKEPSVGDFSLSADSTATVSIGIQEKGPTLSQENLLVYLTEEELFSRDEMYAFRGRVSGLTNITVDFDGDKATRCLATVVIDRVYKGDLSPGQQITMLIPCPIDSLGVWVEDSDIISNLESGMEGIFMPWVYDEASYWEQNGARLMLRDIAQCGLADGMRWAFLSTDRGLVYAEHAYPGAEGSMDLDDIEAYVQEMLGSTP